MGCALRRQTSSRAPQRTMPMLVGIMTLCPQIAWQSGSAPAGQELAIPNLPTLTVLSMVIKIWLFSIRLVPSIACFVRIGIIEARRCGRAKSVLKVWLLLSMPALPVYATLVATPHLSCPILFVWPGWLCEGTRVGFSEFAGRPTALCILRC